jgi:hypothetical protein
MKGVLMKKELSVWFRPGFPQQDLDDLGDTWRPRPPSGK